MATLCRYFATHHRYKRRCFSTFHWLFLYARISPQENRDMLTTPSNPTFRFLTVEEFEALSIDEKIDYVLLAQATLDRAKQPRGMFKRSGSSINDKKQTDANPSARASGRS
jgi:hypothetical protein